MSIALNGQDTISLNDRILGDFADGDVATLDFPNNIVEAKVGRDGNTLFAFNATGKTVTLTLRLIRGSADDKFLNSQLRNYIGDPAAYVLLEGQVTKRSGDGQGNVSSEQYTMNGGIVQKYPNTTSNVEGNTEQSVSVYQLIFPNTDRGFD